MHSDHTYLIQGNAKRLGLRWAIPNKKCFIKNQQPSISQDTFKKKGQVIVTGMKYQLSVSSARLCFINSAKRIRY